MTELAAAAVREVGAIAGLSVMAGFKDLDQIQDQIVGSFFTKAGQNQLAWQGAIHKGNLAEDLGALPTFSI